MNIGLSMPLPAYKVNAAFMGSKAEELGFESIWYAEHPVMPVTTTSKFPDNESGEVPWTYSHFADPFIALAQASGATSKIKLATGITLIPERNPLVLAKTISTLDLFSGGRVLLGIGAGWHREETEMMGGDFDHRWTQTKESILAMKEMWTKDEAEFHGKYYDFPPVRMFPKPMQKPHPPVILGGMARNVFKRIIEWGDGWMPNRATPAMIETSRGTLTELAIEAGRDPDSISITIYGQQPDLDVIRSFHDAGANRVVVSAPLAEDEAEMSRHLEDIADVVFK